MMYIILFFISYSLYYISGIKKNRQVLMSFFILLMMMMVCGLRSHNVGIDTNEYVKSFVNGVDEFDYFATSPEILFRSTFKLATFFQCYSYWLFLLSLLTYLPLFFVLKKYSQQPALSAFLYLCTFPFFFFESMNVIRQSVAIPFMLGAYGSWNENKRIKAFLFVVIASLFHVSSLLMILFLWLKNVSFSKNLIVIGLLSSFVIGLLGVLNFKEVLICVTDFFPGNFNYSVVVDKAIRYTALENSNLTAYFFQVVPLVIISLILIPSVKSTYKFYYNILFFSTMIITLSMSSLGIIVRGMYGQVALLLFIIPAALKSEILIKKQFVCLYIFCTIIIFFIVLYFINKSLVPYEFFWS